MGWFSLACTPNTCERTGTTRQPNIVNFSSAAICSNAALAALAAVLSWGKNIIPTAL